MKAICGECGCGTVFSEGVPAKVICQQCGSNNLVFPEDCVKQDYRPEENIFIILTKAPDQKKSTESEPDSDVKKESEPVKTPVIGDDENKPPVEKKVKKIRKKNSRKIIKRKKS